MSTIREEQIYAALNRAYTLIDYNIHKGLHKQYEFMQQTILADNSLTEEEKTETIILSNKAYDKDKILFNSGTRRICENCNQKCLATLYCEYCVQYYLKVNFSNWTSGNNDIDNLIKNCQMKTLIPSIIIEWIPYNNLQNIEYLTRGGFSEIYTADWIDGKYEEWDSKERKLMRLGNIKVILKQLENVESASQSWFEEAKSHLTISNKYAEIVQCYGLTQNPNGNYMLVIVRLDVNLRDYLHQNYNQITWKESIRITFEIIDALYWIHEENSIHRDLHSGNVLYSQLNDSWHISDLGFCGPANKSSTCIYGNLPYIAPEVINGKEYTFESDVYSIAMLMWEISSGQPPFINYEHDCNLAINIINGMRPKIISEIPSEYKSLMEQCWNADPLKRPDTNTLRIVKLFTSKIHKFENLPEPKNATEAFHSKPYDFSVPYNIDDFGKSSNQNTSKMSGIIEDDSKKLSKVFKKLQISSKDDNQNDYNKKIALTQNVNNEDEDEAYNNPNLHSEEQDEFEIPDDGF
ncbi:unnamed protein product [Rhizophagus irregularis]|nr:unnamed protein product [Rhizophagus irregularis]